MDPGNAHHVASTRSAQLVCRVNRNRFFPVAMDIERRCRDTILTPLRQGDGPHVRVSTVDATPKVIANPLDSTRQVPRRTRTEIEESGVQNAHPSVNPPHNGTAGTNGV